MTRNASLCRIAFIAVALTMVGFLNGCSGNVGDIGQVLLGINADVGVVSQQMALKGWDGFPSNVLELGSYSKDLVTSIAYARAHPSVTFGAGVHKVGNLDEPLPDVRSAFGAVGAGGK